MVADGRSGREFGAGKQTLCWSCPYAHRCCLAVPQKGAQQNTRFFSRKQSSPIHIQLGNHANNSSKSTSTNKAVRLRLSLLDLLSKRLAPLWRKLDSRGRKGDETAIFAQEWQHTAMGCEQGEVRADHAGYHLPPAKFPIGEDVWHPFRSHHTLKTKHCLGQTPDQVASQLLVALLAGSRNTGMAKDRIRILLGGSSHGSYGPGASCCADGAHKSVREMQCLQQPKEIHKPCQNQRDHSSEDCARG